MAQEEIDETLRDAQDLSGKWAQAHGSFEEFGKAIIETEEERLRLEEEEKEFLANNAGKPKGYF